MCSPRATAISYIILAIFLNVIIATIGIISMISYPKIRVELIIVCSLGFLYSFWLIYNGRENLKQSNRYYTSLIQENI